MSIFETNVVVHLLEAAMEGLPFGILCNFGNQWKYGRHLVLEFIWDSQIEPFIELNIGLDNIINRFRADFVRRVTGIRASRGLYPTLEELVHGDFFLYIKTMLWPALSAVVTTNLSCRFWRHFSTPLS